MMKGYLKRFKVKRMLAMLLAAVMVLTICMPQSVSAGTADDRYKGSSTIQSLLTDFEYVVRGDVTLTNSGHCVGAAAIGGSLTGDNSIGDGAKTASYAKHIVRGSIGNGTGFVGTTQDFYYDTSDVILGSAFTHNPNYIDVEGMFPSIISQSEKMAYNSQNTVASYDENESAFITVDFTKSKVYNISYDDLYKAEGINVIIDNVDDFSYDAYTINVIGVGANRLDFNCETDYGAKNTSGVDFKINGSFGQFLMNQFRLDQQVADGQSNVAGMKFIWNFPDATDTISWSGMPGHLVAPKARVEAQNRFEGGVIADSVYANGQAHFFPYGDYQLNNSGTAVTPKDIMIKKSYLSKSYATMTPGTQAKFTLYSDVSCADEFIVPGAKDIEVNADTGYVTFDSEGLGLECGKSYYVKETVVPKGFDINETVYECAISTGGLVTYRAVGSNSTYSNDVPVCENFYKTSDESKGTIFVAVVEKTDNGTVNVKGATVAYELKDANGNVIKSGSGDTTNSDYVIFEGLPAGTYTISLKTIPDGYNELATAEREVVVNLNKTAYHTFVLTKSVADVIINVRENNVNGKGVPGGAIQITGPNGYSRTETVGNTGTVKIENLTVGEDYKVTLIKTPNGYNDPTSKVIDFELPKNGYEDTYVLTRQVGTVVVNIVDEATDNKVNVSGGSVTITLPDGTTRTEEDTYGNGTVTFTNVPVGTSKVQIATAPENYILANPNPTKDVIVTNGATATETLPVKQETQKGSLTIKVVDTNDNATCDPSNKVTIKITESNGKTITEEVSIDGNIISLSDLPVGEYTIDVSTPDGWKTVKTTVDDQAVTNPKSASATVKNQDITDVVVTVEEVGLLTVTVQEKDGDTMISDALIRVESTDVNSSFITIERDTNADGKITLENIPLGNYKVTVVSVDNKWTVVDSNVQNVTVVDNNGKADFEVTQTTGTLTVNVVEKDNENIKIQDAVIKVTDKEGKEITVPYSTGTDVNGQVVIDKLPIGDYKVTIESATGDYILPTEANKKTQEVNVPASGNNVDFKLPKAPSANGELKVLVYEYDAAGGEIGPHITAEVEVIGLNGSKETLHHGDTRTGLSEGTYTTSIKIPNGYVLKEGKIEQTQDVKDNHLTTYTYKLIKAGNIEVTVKDSDNENVNIEVSIVDSTGKKVASEETGDDGIITFEKLPIGDYKAVINEIPDQYGEPVSKELPANIKVEDNGTVTNGKADFVLPLAGKITVTVYEIGTTNVISNANIKLIYANDQTDVASKKTDAYGQVTFDMLKDATYKVAIADITDVAGNYVIVDTSANPDEVTRVLSERDRIKEAKFYVNSMGNLEFTVREDAPDNQIGQVIQGAKVEVKDQNGTILKDNGNNYFVTSADGKIVINNIPAGNYTVTVKEVPTGYKLITSSEERKVVNVPKNNGTASEEAKVVPTATLVVDVVDKESNTELLKDSKIKVEDQYGNVVDVTAIDGTVTLPNWPITIEDDKPTKVTITQVPGTHVLPTEESEVTVPVKVKSGVNSAVLKAPKKPATTGDLVITVRDETTGEIVPGAIVEITYPNGSIEIAETDANGKINRPGVTTGKYYVQVGAVPPGYTKPSKEKTLIEVTTEKKEVEVVITKPSTTPPTDTPTTNVSSAGNSNGGQNIAKSNSAEIARKAPKTGDTGYTPIALAMMVISIVGLAGIVVYRKKTENER